MTDSEKSAVKNKLRILHVCWDGSIGGLSRFVYEVVANQISDPDLDVSICYSKGVGPYYEKVKRLGISVNNLGIESGYQILSGTKKLYSLIRNGNYNVVQLHCPSPPLILANYIAKRKLKKKPIFLFTDHGFLLSSEAPFSILEIKKRLTRSILVWYFNHLFDYNIVNSHYVENKFLKYGVMPNRLKVIYHGINFRNIKTIKNRYEIKKSLGVDASAFIVGTVSRLVYYKRVDRLIEVARLTKNSNKNVYYVIVGDGDRAIQLKKLASKYNIEDNVLFLGEQLAPYDLMKAMDLFVLTSSGDAFASVILEAQALGIPVALFKDSGGIIETINDEINGFIVNDCEDLANRIISFSKDISKLGIVGSMGQKSAMELNIANFSEKIKEFYTSH